MGVRAEGVFKMLEAQVQILGVWLVGFGLIGLGWVWLSWVVVRCGALLRVELSWVGLRSLRFMVEHLWFTVHG